MADSAEQREDEVQGGADAENGQDDSDNDADDSLEPGSASDGSQAGSGVGSGKKKKKKKSKKKKKAGADNGSAGGEQGAQQASQQPKLDKAEAERRYTAALNAIKSEDLWVELRASSLQDAKAKKLLEAVKRSVSVTSLDLSQNFLTDDTAQALAATLGVADSVPGLITLDLRENNFTEQGLTIIEGLKKVRRDLNILTGSIVVAGDGPPGAGAGAGPVKGAAADKAMRDLSDSRLVRKYFQVGAEEEEDAVDAAPEPSVDPGELWQQLEAAAAVGGVESIPHLQGPMRQLCAALHAEVSAQSAPYSPTNPGASPHIHACLQHLPMLAELLGIVPPPVTVTYHPDQQAAVGSHRVFVAEAVAGLLASGSEAVDEAVASAGLVPRVLHLALAHPTNSAVQERALRVLRCGLTSCVPALVGSVLAAPGWGARLPPPPPPAPPTKPGEQHGTGDAAAAASGALCDPLPTLLAAIGERLLGVLPGQRDSYAGFVIEASKLLLAAHRSTADGKPAPAEDAAAESGKGSGSEEEEEGPRYHPRVRVALLANAAWCEFVAPAEEGGAGGGGVLAHLVSEQEGDLGGPRAVRSMNSLMEGPDLAKLAGGGLISGHEILAFLQGMSMQSQPS